MAELENEALYEKSQIIELDALSLCLKDIDNLDYLLENKFSVKVVNHYKKEFDFIMKFRLKHKKIPSLNTFRIECPDVDLVKNPHEPIEYYYTSIIKIYEELATIGHVEKINDLMGKNKLVDIRAESIEYIDRFNEVAATKGAETTAEALEEYKRIYYDETLGVPYSWETLNRATRGKHPGQFILYTGIAKAGKTFTVMYDLTKAYATTNTNILCISLEMSKFEMLTRHYCMLTNRNYTLFTRRAYGKKDRDSIFKEFDKKTKERKNWFRIETRRTSGDFLGDYNMNWIKYLTVKYRPKILWIDGLYLLKANNPQDNGGWKDLQSNSRAMKELADELGIIAIGTVQMGREEMGKKKKASKPSMKHIGGTVAYLQDADIIFGINRPEELRLAGQNQILTLAARECQNVTVTFNWDLSRMNFDQTLGEIEGEDTIDGVFVSEKADKAIDF